MSDRVRPEPAKFKMTHWRRYNQALKARGALMIWLDRDLRWSGLARGKVTAVPAQPEPMESGDRCEESRIATPIDALIHTPAAVATPTATPQAPVTTPIATVAVEPGKVDTPIDAVTTTAADTAPTGIRDDDSARFLRVRAGIEVGRIKPSIRAIYAAEGASQAVARRYLVELERSGIIELAGKGKGYRLIAA